MLNRSVCSESGHHRYQSWKEHDMNDYNQETITINCPYCGETISPVIDYSAGEQQYYEDCTVCCAPILFTLSESINGDILVAVRREDD